MADNITSVLNKDPAGDLSLTDILYLIQGTGSKRDRNVTLQRLFEFFGKQTKSIKLEGDKYTIEIDSATGSFSIVSIDGGFEIKYNGNAVDITDSVEVEGSVVALDEFVCSKGLKVKEDLSKSNSNGVEITMEGLKFKNEDGTYSDTSIERGGIEANQVIGSFGKFSKRLNVGSSLAVDEDECRVRVKTVVQNDMAVSEDLEVQGFLKSADCSFIRAHSESFIQLPFVDASTEADLKNPSAIIGSQILGANPLKGDIAMVRNMCGHNVEFDYQSSTSSNGGVIVVAVGESILYAYDGSYWRKVW